MESTVEKILEKILLPVSKGWEISGVSDDEQKQEIYVDLVYTSRSVFLGSSEYLVSIASGTKNVGVMKSILMKRAN